MAMRIFCLALALFCLPLVGCGTVANVTQQGPNDVGMAPFGGVHHAWACLEGTAHDTPPHAKSGLGPYPQTILTLVSAVDLPLSLVGDIVTWPYVMAYMYVNQPIPNPPVLISDPAAPTAQTVPTMPHVPSTPQLPTPPKL